MLTNKRRVLLIHFLILLKQVCYRVLMQLCGQYGHPALAVKVSFSVLSFFMACEYSHPSLLLAARVVPEKLS